MKTFIAILMGMTVWAGASQAQWIHQKGEDDPFAGGVEHMAMTLSRVGEIVGFRCRSAADLSLIFISVEKPGDEAKTMSLLPVEIQVIVDDQPQKNFVGEIDVTPDGNRYRFTAMEEALVELTKEASAAKKRFAVGVELMGKRVYSAAVNVQGSRGAIGKLVTGCQLQQN